MKLSSEQVDEIVAGIRGGMEAMVGGSRCHTTYRGVAGELVVEDFDEGATDERPCSEGQLRHAIAADPEAFLDVLRRPLRDALRDSLLGIRTERAPLACIEDLLVYGDCLHHRELLDAALRGQPPPATLTTIDGLDVYHAIMSAIGYREKSAAAGELGVRVYAALAETAGGRELRRWRRYRATFREMAGDSAGALEDLRWELSQLAKDDGDAPGLRREIGQIADRMLLAAIEAAPDDDAPRLVWADALLERGDPRGELIVAQCTLARLDADDSARASLEPRVRQLIAAAEWARPEQTFRRGFVDSVAVSWGKFAYEADALFARSPPLRELRFIEEGPNRMPEPEAALLDPRLVRIPALDLGTNIFVATDTRIGETQAFGPEVARVLHRRLPGLRELALRGARLDEAELAMLGQREGLEKLVMEGSVKEPAGVAALLNAGGLRELRCLEIPGTRIGDAEAAGLARLTHLEELDLRLCPVGPATARLLAQLPVRRLGLAKTAIGDEGLSLLRKAPRLVALDLGSNAVGRDGIAALADMPLHSLSLQDTHPSEELVALLARGRIAASLRRLNLGSLPPGDERSKRAGGVPKLGPGVARILTGMPLLWDLDLRECAIDGDAAVALLDALPALRCLRLGQCALDDAGLAKLVAHPGFERLETLMLDHNALGPDAGAILASAPRLPLRLSLRHNRIGDAGGRALAAAPAAARIVDLDLRETGTEL